MAFGISSHHRAELNVEIGKTSLEALQKFNDEAVGKGGGEVRGKKNKDGSYTLYVVEKGKKGVFESANTRTQKQQLGKDLVHEILSRRLPSGKEGESGATMKALTEKGRKEPLPSLNTILDNVRSETSSGISDKGKAMFNNLDRTMNTPEVRDAFRSSLGEADQAKVDFLSKKKEFDKAKDFTVKVQLGKELKDLAGKMGLPDGQARILDDAFSTFEMAVEMANGNELSALGKDKLTDLNTKLGTAGNTVKEGLTGKLDEFSKTEAFGKSVSTAFSKTAFGEDSARPESYLLPGSGQEFQERVAERSTVTGLMGDQELSTKFREHIAFKDGSDDALDDYDGAINLHAQGKDKSVTNETLMQGIEEHFLLMDEVEVLKGELVQIREKHLSEMDNVGMENLQPQKEGETVEDLCRAKINEFLEARKNEAVEHLRDHATSFKEANGKLIADKVGGEMLSEQLEGGRLEDRSQLGPWARFDGRSLVGSGGATGSGQAQFGRHLYQVKGSVVHSGFGRKFKSGKMNHENYGEVIASNISRAMVGDKNHVPEVALRHNKGKNEAMVTSRYLSGGLGTLTEVYVKNVGPLPKGQGKHAQIHLDSTQPSGGGIMRLGTIASHDIRHNIALSALMGDHDVNTGNMIMLDNGHVGRIDFGHAFNELICGVRGVDKLFGKTGVQGENRILDFFNREKVGGLSSKDQRSKLWRDYTGVGPSDDMAAALKEVAITDSARAREGVDEAKAQFTELVNSLKDSEDPGDKALLKDIMKSLKQMSQNVGKPVTTDSPTLLVDQVFANLEGFIMDGQKQMLEVAELCQLQSDIDKFVRNNGPDTPVPPGILQKFHALTREGSSLRVDDNSLSFMKTSSLHPPFKGDLETYIATRRSEIPREDLQRVGD